MSLRSQLGRLHQKLICSSKQRVIALGKQGPMVSFCFDDFPRTAYIVGGALLRSFGAHGTYYASLGLMNTRNSLGDQFRSDDLTALLAEGHELGSHTFKHTSCRHGSPAVFVQDVLHGRQAIEQLTGSLTGNFAFPFGHVSVHLKGRIGAQMDSCRGIYGGINAPTADLNLLRANSLYGDVASSGAAERLLQQNARQNGWLLFYTHDVQESPSPFGCTPALLQQTICLARETGSEIVSVRQALARLEAPAKLPIPAGRNTSVADPQLLPPVAH